MHYDRLAICIKPDFDEYSECDPQFSQCDLCDLILNPCVKWACEHDDRHHSTTICIVCVRKLLMEMEKQEKIEGGP